MKLWIISDTHQRHAELPIPEGIDTVIHCGDFANSKDIPKNYQETLNFLEWYSNFYIPNKILNCGNHDLYAERWPNLFTDLCKDFKIIPLIHDYLELDGFKFFGSPYTPTYMTGWAFNRNRGAKLERLWAQIPEVDILITHGPPKGILDWAQDIRDRKKPYQAGSKTLLNALTGISPKIHCFGHMHSCRDFNNYGIYMNDGPTIFANAAVWAFNQKHIFNGLFLDIALDNEFEF